MTGIFSYFFKNAYRKVIEEILTNPQSFNRWLVNNKHLNCTPNWQAGKPIHSGPDSET